MMRTARYWNIALGVWLFISAFIWRHSSAQFTNAWIVGLLVTAFAVAALAYPRARYANTVLAVWLFISAWVLPIFSVATVWNHVLVAIAVFAFSLVGSEPTLPARQIPPEAPSPRTTRARDARDTTDRQPRY